MINWKPIGTCPMDGLYLLHRKHDDGNRYWIGNFFYVGSFGRGNWREFNYNPGFSDGIINPTHWAELTPPKSGKKKT